MTETGPLGRLPLSRSELDRAAERRGDASWQEQAWSDPRAQVLVVADASAPVTGPPEEPRLDLLAPSAVPDGERFFLGLDGDGVPYFAVAAATPPESSAGLRELGPLLGARDAGLLVTAAALANWHATHRHCPRCGTPTVLDNAGWTRRCPADGSDHFPRTDPAVIMTVVDADDRVLLGRQRQWPPNRFSTLAGFVEAGESLEQAVRREVLEEAGVVVGAVTYLGNQPWPFPCSLMLGFTASAETTELTFTDAELSDARWYSRERLADDVAAGRLLLPGRVSIARRLIEHWYGGPLGM